MPFIVYRKYFLLFLKGKFLESIKFYVKFPNDFSDGMKKEVVAICKVGYKNFKKMNLFM